MGQSHTLDARVKVSVAVKNGAKELLTGGPILSAQAKGRQLRIFKPHEVKPSPARKKERGAEFWVELVSRPVPATSCVLAIIVGIGVRHMIRSPSDSDDYEEKT